MTLTEHHRRAKTFSKVLALSLCFVTGMMGLSSAQNSARPDWMRGRAVNVVLSIQHTDDMRIFYGEVLGLESLRDINLPARVGRPFDTIMIQFRVGQSVVKMIPHEGIAGKPGGRVKAAGLRVLSLPTTDGDAVAARIRTRTGQTVMWQEDQGYRVAWVEDPDGNEIELRGYGSGDSSVNAQRLELCITTNDLKAAQRHYGEWLGLPEAPTVELAGYPGTSHRYHVGESILRLWSPGRKLPVDTGYTKDGYGLRYVQFIVKDAESLHEKMVSVGAAVAQGPTPLGEVAVLLFGADPDGVINECVGPAQK